MSIVVPPLIRGTDERLRKACAPIRRMSKRSRAIAERLKVALTAYKGIGIAAPQIGEHVRICIVLRDWKPGLHPITLFDPFIAAWSREMITTEEGCLSFPGEKIRIERHARVIVRHMTQLGNIVETPFSGVEAVCVQHEIDHLNGIPFQMRATA